MSAFLYGIGLQWKMNLRSKEILVHYYVVPLGFYLFIGGIFTSIMPDAYKTLIQAMAVFGVSMGGVMGSPYPLVEVFGSEVKKAYQVGRISLWTIGAGNFISAFLHLFLMSMVIFFTGPIFFGALRPQNMGMFFAGLVLTIAASLGVGTVFGLFVRSASKLAMVTMVVFLPSLMLSGIMFPAAMLPSGLEIAGKIFPATWGFAAMCAGGGDATLLLPLVGFTVVLLGLSAWKLRKTV